MDTGLIAEYAPRSPWCTPSVSRNAKSLDQYGGILASPRGSSRPDTSPHGPFEAGHSPQSKLGQQLKESEKEMEAHSPSSDQLRKNAAECIRLAEEARTS